MAPASRRDRELIASKPVEIVAGALRVALLAVVIAAGFAGPPDSLSNFAPSSC